MVALAGYDQQRGHAERLHLVVNNQLRDVRCLHFLACHDLVGNNLERHHVVGHHLERRHLVYVQLELKGVTEKEMILPDYRH